MNHSRTNVSIRHCPTCGVILNAQIRARCNEAVHATRRKERNDYCFDCGKKLRT